MNDGKHFLIVGPPGGGKGTISKRITDEFGIEAISSGDMIRSQIAQETEVNILECYDDNISLIAR